MKLKRMLPGSSVFVNEFADISAGLIVQVYCHPTISAKFIGNACGRIEGIRLIVKNNVVLIGAQRPETIAADGDVSVVIAGENGAEVDRTRQRIELQQGCGMPENIIAVAKQDLESHAE